VKKRTTQKAADKTRQQAAPAIKRLLRVADIATFLSIACGALSFLFVLDERFVLAGIAMLGSLVLDFLDGRIARLMGQESDFGMYLDSMADAMVFGMVPVAIALYLLPTSPVLTLSAIFFLCCGAFRLARFQATRIAGGFQGVPITVNGIIVPIILFLVPDAWYWFVWPSYFIVMGIIMASSFKVKKL
jgi:CDP-diacylglycerol--serine O-phosphatidyltransferase